MKKNLWFVLAALALAALVFFLFHRGGTGAVARVDVAGGQTLRLPLNEDGTFSIEGAALPVTLQVKDGAVRFINSVCPDHICEHTGWLQLEGETAICAPAGVVVTVE